MSLTSRQTAAAVHAFWSLTVYGMDFNTIHNSINRWSVSDRSTDLDFNDGGLLTFYLSAKKLRMYNPKEVMLDPDTLEDYLPEVQKR